MVTKEQAEYLSRCALAGGGHTPGGMRPDPGSKGVYAVAFSPDGTTLAFGDYNGSAYLWNLATDEHSTLSGLGAGEPVTAVAFAPDSPTLALAVGNGVTYLADYKTGVISGSFSDPGGTGVFSLAFAPNGTLAVADTNHTVYLWNTNTKTVKDTFADPGTKTPARWRSRRTAPPWPSATAVATPTC